MDYADRRVVFPRQSPVVGLATGAVRVRGASIIQRISHNGIVQVVNQILDIGFMLIEMPLLRAILSSISNINLFSCVRFHGDERPARTFEAW